MLPLLTDPEIYPRAHAASALGQVRDPRALEVLVKLLKDGDGWVASHAAVGLGALGDRRAVSALKEAAIDQNWQLQEAATAALLKLDSKQ